MGTENDRFGQQLGRSFRRIWSRLASGQDVADDLATYLVRTCVKNDEEIDAFCRGRMRALAAYDGLLLRDLGLDDGLLEREGNRSYAAMHASDAYRDAIIRRSRPEDFPLLFAQRLFDTAVGLATIRRPYAHEVQTLAILHALRDSVSAQACNRIRKRLGLAAEPIRRTRRIVTDQKVHLASPIGYTA